MSSGPESNAPIDGTTIDQRIKSMQEIVTNRPDSTTRSRLQYQHTSRVPYLRAQNTLLPIIGGVFGVHDRHRFDINWQFATKKSNESRFHQLYLRPVQLTESDSTTIQPLVGEPLLVDRENPYPQLPDQAIGYEALVAVFSFPLDADQNSPFILFGEKMNTRLPLQLGRDTVARFVDIILTVTESKLA
jgi:hypothetical protein